MKKVKILKRKRSSTKKKIALITSGTVLLAIAVILIFSLVQFKEDEPEVIEPEAIDTAPPATPENLTDGILLDKDTNTESEYMLMVLRHDEIESELLLKWMANSIAGETTDGENPVYYALYNNSSPNLDIYLFMPEAKQVMGDVIHSSVKVTEANTALIIYIETDENTTHTRDSLDLILHIQATSDKAKTKTEKLIINGVEYSCANTTFTALH